MSIEALDPDSDDTRIETEAQGVAVTKHLARSDSDVTLVVFTITSTRSDDVRVVIEEEIPADVPSNKVGLHPEYRGDQWTVTDDRLVFETYLTPDEEVVTLFGLNVPTVEEARPFLDEPRIETTIPLDGDAPGRADDAAEAPDPHDDGDLADHFTDDDAADDGATTDEETDDGATTDEETDDGDEVDDAETDDGDEVDDAETAVDEVADVAAGTPDEGVAVDETEGKAADATESSSVAAAAAVGAADESAPEPRTEAATEEPTPDGNDATADADPVARLVDALEDRELTDHERAVLADVLGGDDAKSNPNTLEARFRRVQRTVNDLAAYEDALAEFIEENGGATQILEELRDDLATVRSDLDELDDRVAATSDEVEAVDDRLSDTTDRVATLADRCDRTDEDLADVRETLTDLETTHDEDVEALWDDVRGLETTVEDLSAFHESAVSSLQEDVDACREWQQSLSEAIESPFETVESET